MGIVDLLKFKRSEILRLAQGNQDDEIWNGVWVSGLKEERNHEN